MAFGKGICQCRGGERAGSWPLAERGTCARLFELREYIRKMVKIFLCVLFALVVAVGARQHLRVNQRHAAPVVLDAKADDAKADDAKVNDTKVQRCDRPQWSQACGNDYCQEGSLDQMRKRAAQVGRWPQAIAALW